MLSFHHQSGRRALGNLNQAIAIAQRMREKGKPDDQIRDTLRTWDLDDAAIDDILAGLTAPADAATTPASNDPHDYAVALAAKMRNDGRADDFIRDSLRACDVSEADIDTILAAAPPTGTPVRHEVTPVEKSENKLFAWWMNRRH